MFLACLAINIFGKCWEQSCPTAFSGMASDGWNSGDLDTTDSQLGCKYWKSDMFAITRFFICMFVLFSSNMCFYSAFDPGNEDSTVTSLKTEHSTEHNCDVISEKLPYFGTNSVILDPLFSRFCDTIFIQIAQEAIKNVFFLDAHGQQILMAMSRPGPSCINDR